MNKTRMGKAMTAVADNPLGASVAGINPEKVILSACAVG
jgi:branched-subunit amino acid ABC-type transport system permease component